MTRSGKFAFYSAVIGFLLPLLLLSFYSAAHAFGYEPNTTLLSWVCPQTLLTVFLDQTPIVIELMVWLIICLSNAVFYSLPGLVALLVMGFVAPAPTPPSILK